MNEPLRIARQGSLELGGRLIHSDFNDGEHPDDERWPPGLVHIDHVYASYQYPAEQKYAYPILFNSGGGHSARVYDTTPDGREGWLTQFVRAGFAVYGVDRVNVGRSGEDISKINAVRLGKAPVSELPWLNRYAAESCWTTFRWGPKFGEAFPDTQFPIEFAETYYKQTLSNYRAFDEDGKSVDAFVELLDSVGPSTIQTWSSSGLLGYLTAARRPELTKGILAIESSVTAFGNIPETDMDALARVPIVIIIGDRAEDRNVSSRAFAEALNARGGDVTIDILPESGIRGNGHTLMLEKNNHVIMQRMVAWLESHIYAKT